MNPSPNLFLFRFLVAQLGELTGERGRLEETRDILENMTKFSGLNAKFSVEKWEDRKEYYISYQLLEETVSNRVIENLLHQLTRTIWLPEDFKRVEEINSRLSELKFPARLSYKLEVVDK